MVAPILTTKLHIPSLRPNLVPRERLLERLDQSLQRKLAVISAPAGFGKTTLLGEWISSLQAAAAPPVEVAWISLDDGDNDPARFTAYLTAALRRADSGIGRLGGDRAESAGPGLQEPQLVKLINQVAARPREFLLVLDDYHLITSQTIHDAVLFLIDHLPENLHLALATRADPPLPLPRLRARGELTELRQTDLRFTTEEATTFLNDVMGLDLSVQDVAALEARTEGWIAGLQMAALSLQGQSLQTAARSDFIAAFSGSHRFVLDYLVEEVLERQSPALQEFLLKTSILERLTGPLCDWVVGEEMPGQLERGQDAKAADSSVGDSQSILEHLETANLFIVPLDNERRWYRYHRLFADLLQQRLQRSRPDLLPALHYRASVWHAEQGLMNAAIDHALAARDCERAAHLIEESVEAVFMRSEVATFLKWMEELPDEWTRNRPTLGFFHAWALMMCGSSPEVVEARLQELGRTLDGSEGATMMVGRMAVLRAYLMLLKADWRRATELSRQALQHLPEGDLFLRSLATWMLSLADHTEQDLQDRKASLERVSRMGQEIGNALVAVAALCQRASLQMQQGRLHRAREILERALQLATDHEGRRLPIASEALISLGNLWREWNDLETAAQCLVEGIDLAKQWSELASFEGYYPLARVRLAQGDVDAAREALEAGRQLADRSEITQVDDVIAELREAQFSVLRGDIDGAVRWAETQGLVCGVPPMLNPDVEEPQDYLGSRLRKYEYLVLARLFIMQGRGAEALELLEPLLAQARQWGRIDLTIWIQILRALAWHTEGDDVQALDAVGEALRLAEPGGYIRTFLDEGEPMVRLLQQAVSQEIAPVYAKNLLAAFGDEESGEPELGPVTPAARPLIDALSDREAEVLQLLAAGLSNPEVADELFIAVSTVRSHCKNIYRKLDVHNRWDAVERGRELGLV
jgi:LuxR family maltose regulon positive regulatory protein